MTNLIEKLTIEKTDLNSKIKHLYRFSQSQSDIPMKHQCLLAQQLDVMTRYSSLLEQRIALLKNTEI